jgi:Flp pilus assembly pilin Flp
MFDHVLRVLRKGQQGHDLTEYALLVVLVALAVIMAIMSLGTNIGTVFSNAATNISRYTPIVHHGHTPTNHTPAGN